MLAGPAWTDERVELLKKLWADGKSSSQIAADLNCGFSRNAVIGKVYRLGLAKREKNQGQPRPRKNKRALLRLMLQTQREAMQRPDPLQELLDSSVREPVADTAPEQSDRAVLLTEAGENNCRWPLGEPAYDMLVCGARPIQGFAVLPQTLGYRLCAAEEAGGCMTASRALPAVDTSNPPFFLPDILVDLPVPPSVNRARKIDWSAYPRVKNWQKQADKELMFSKQVRGAKKITGPYELQIIVDGKQTGCDISNLEKCLTDYLVRIELLADDGPKHLRRLVMEFGEAPKGVRCIVKPMGAA